MKAKVLAGTVMMRPAFGTRMKPVVGPDGQPVPEGTRLVTANGKTLRSGVLEVDEEELPWVVQMFPQDHRWIEDKAQLRAPAPR